jgi:hypothetical protein
VTEQEWLASTPWPQSGLVFKFFDAQFGKPKDAIVARAKTERMRANEPTLLAAIAAERARDPHNAALEFDAKWAVHGTGNAFDPDSPQRSLVECAPSVSGQVVIGGDLGFVADASAFCAAQEGSDGRIVVVDLLELRPKKGKPLSLTNAMRQAADFAASYHVNEILVDNHSLAQARDSIEQARLNLQLRTVDASQSGRDLRFTGAIQSFKDGRVVIPKRFAALTQQLARIVATPKAGGGHRFSVARAGGDHADSAMAFLLGAEPIESRLTSTSLWRALERDLAERAASGRPYVPPHERGLLRANGLAVARRRAVGGDRPVNNLLGSIASNFSPADRGVCYRERSAGSRSRSAKWEIAHASRAVLVCSRSRRGAVGSSIRDRASHASLRRVR